MNPKPASWLFPTALVGILMLIFPPMGYAETYGRVTRVSYQFYFGDVGSDVVDYTRLFIQFAIVAVIFYSIAYWRANRMPKEAKPQSSNHRLIALLVILSLTFWTLVAINLPQNERKDQPPISEAAKITSNAPVEHYDEGDSDREPNPNERGDESSSNPSIAEKEFENPE